MNDEYKIQEPRRGMRKSLLLLVALVVVALLVTYVYYSTKVNRAATSESHPVIFVVEKGSTNREIATELSDQDVIASKNIFIIYSWLHGVGGKIQAGNYNLDSDMTIAEIVDVLTHGKVVTDSRNVTIIEGSRVKQIGQILVDKKIIDSQANFQKILNQKHPNFKFDELAFKFGYEGFLFPDTYTLSKDQDASDLVDKMLANFENKITDKMIADIATSKRSLSEVLTIASIVEKEVGRNKSNLDDSDILTMQKERRLVASVFYNRLEVNMALESDATVNYVTGKSTRSISIEDTKLKSPYNTYANRGLPPTPISNPGLDSIMAAIYPTDSSYVYFLNSPEGTAYFATTLEEHNANKAKYLK